MGFKRLFALATLVFAPLTHAAFVTIDEPSLDAIYSQATFGANTVDIRIGPVTVFVRPDLLDITTNAQINAIFALHVGPQDIVNFYFVDTISACGATISTGIIGCGETPGQDFVVESVFAANTSIPSGGNITIAAQLLAHELGHNLGLPHRTGNFLMNPSINGFGALNAAEVSTILASPLVHMDANGQRFVQINPVLITAVPEPSSLAFTAAGLALVGFIVRRRRPAPAQRA